MVSRLPPGIIKINLCCRSKVVALSQCHCIRILDRFRSEWRILSESTFARRKYPNFSPCRRPATSIALSPRDGAVTVGPPPLSDWQMAGAAVEWRGGRSTRGGSPRRHRQWEPRPRPRPRGVRAYHCHRHGYMATDAGSGPAAAMAAALHPRPTAAARGAAALWVHSVCSHLVFFFCFFGPCRHRRASAARRPPPGRGARRQAAPPRQPSRPTGRQSARDHQGSLHVGTRGRRSSSLLWPAHQVPSPPPPRTPRASQDGAALGRRLTPHCSSARWCCGGTAHPSTPAAARPSRGAAPAPRRSPTTRPSRGARPTPR